MAIATVLTRATLGMEAPLVSVEVHLGNGLPGLAIVGLVETAVRESRERVRAAIDQSGFAFPQRRITVNLAPADLPKRGGRFDLAIALGILAASDQVPREILSQAEFLGELAFTGALRDVHQLLPALLAAEHSDRACIVPVGCAAQAALLRGAECFTAGNLCDVVAHLRGDRRLPRAVADETTREPTNAPDMADVVGQSQALRALEIAAAGQHHLLMVGPPGTGKTMLAQRLPGLLPRLGKAAATEQMVIRSVAGLDVDAMPTRPPLRCPHHSATAPALVGGGNPPRPGEISLAHNGVLFMDELPEFTRPVLESLREPMEKGRVFISRAGYSSEFPARFQLVAAMNPCRCGFHGDLSRVCTCSPEQITAYQTKISGPLLDRIELSVMLNRERVRLDDSPTGRRPSSCEVRQRVARAAGMQLRRSACRNSQLSQRATREHCWPDRKGRRLLERAADRFALSRRACDSLLRVARTVADLGESRDGCGVREGDVAEALQLRVRLPH